MKNEYDMFIPHEKEIREEWARYYNRIAMDRFGATYGNLEKNRESRNFLAAYGCVRDYIVKYNVSFTELSDEDVVRIIWESHYANDLQKMRIGRPFLYEQTRSIVIIAAIIAEINGLLGTSTTIQDCGLGFTEQVICPHCNKPTRLTEAANPNLGPHRLLYVCEKCGAFCGTHEGTDIPLGLPGNDLERKYRGVVHRLFDSYWKKKGMTRDEAYTWLAGNIGMFVKDCHIGRFDVDRCKKVIKAIGLPDDLEIADYQNMINTDTIPWSDSPDNTASVTKTVSADSTVEKVEDKPAKEIHADFYIHGGGDKQCRKMAAVLGKHSIPELVKYICNDLGAAYDLKSLLISFITEYHLLQISNNIEDHAPSIQDEIRNILR